MAFVVVKEIALQGSPRSFVSGQADKVHALICGRDGLRTE